MVQLELAMKLMDALEGRRSVRRYDRRPVPESLVIELLRSAESAPSAGNLRARKYIVVGRPDLRKALALAAYGQEQVEEAPILIVILADFDRSRTRYGDRGYLYAILDASSAITCLLLAAFDAGLGACWNGAFDDQMVKDLLGYSEDLVPVGIISLGWPLESPPAPPRRSMEELVRWEME